MQAYEKSMLRGDTHLVLKPDSDFFRFFSDPSGQPSPAAQATPRRRRRRRHPPSRPEIGDDGSAFMSDLVAAIGLIFAIEGIMFAAFPLRAKRADGGDPGHSRTPNCALPASAAAIIGVVDRLAGAAMRKARTNSAGALSST